jgi:thioredoxin 1
MTIAATRRALLVLGIAGLCSAALSFSGQVQAQGVAHIPFTAEAFAKAQAEGKSILVDVTAPWCPTCKTQKPIIDSLTQSQPLSKVMVFAVDFDSQKEVLRSFRVMQQSTLIAFKGQAETARSVGDTKAESIAALLKSAI